MRDQVPMMRMGRDLLVTLQGDLASPDFRMNTGAQARVAEARAKEKLRSRLKDRLLKQLGQGEEAN